MTTLCAFIGVLVIIQLWLVTASLEALLSGDRVVLFPAAAASTALLLVNAGLMLGGWSFDRRMRRRA